MHHGTIKLHLKNTVVSIGQSKILWRMRTAPMDIGINVEGIEVMRQNVLNINVKSCYQ